LDGEQGAEVYIGATKLEQAKLIHDEADRMVRASPFLMEAATIHKNNIMFKGTNSFARPLGSDKPFDGPNPSAVIFDELHAWREHHRGFFDTMTTGSGSRTQPIQFIVTTAGNEKSLIFHEEQDYARGVIEGEIEDNRLFALIFELDADIDPFADDFDFELMAQANPNMGISVFEDYLAEQLHEAKHKPAAKYRFKTKHANQCASSVEDVMSAEVWDACAGPLTNWMQSEGVGAGVDIGGRDDLAAYAMAAKFEVGRDKDDRPIYRQEVKSRCFIAEDTKRDLNAEPFRTWIDQGKLTVCKYVISTLKEALIEDAQAYGIEWIAYDPYQATQLAEDLEAEGMKPVKMPQNHTHFNESIAQYLAEVSDGRFTPCENDVLLRWCALNMMVSRDGKDRMMPDKKHSKEKIDAAVAMLMAKRACNLALPPMDGPMVL